MKTKIFLSVCALLLILTPKDVLSQHYVSSTPAWFKKPPKAENGRVIGIGKSWSANQNIAEKKAIMSANEDISRQLKTPKKIKKTFSKFFAKGRTEKTTIEKEAFEVSISNSTVLNRAFKKHKKGFLCFIMIEADVH